MFWSVLKKRSNPASSAFWMSAPFPNSCQPIWAARVTSCPARLRAMDRGVPWSKRIFTVLQTSALFQGATTRTDYDSPPKQGTASPRASRAALMKKMTPLLAEDCPFIGLPEKRAGRWGQGITAEKMKDCRWLQPTLVGVFEFVEWTPDNHLQPPSSASAKTKNRRAWC